MNLTPLKVLTIGCLLVTGPMVSQETIGQMPPWEEGVLEIHHINTGRGDAAFFIFPDATTLLVDAGDMSETRARTLSARNAALKPNSSKSAPAWIVDYIHQFFPANRPKQLDYALITHYHDDHFGEMDANRKIAGQGAYYLTGITEVGSLLPIKTLLDRGSDYPIDLKAKKNRDAAQAKVSTLENYWNFADYQSNTNGLLHKKLVAGETSQIKLQKFPKDFPDFTVRVIAVNGTIWTGVNSDSYSVFAKGNDPGENPLSACIKMSYGDFDYFTGGDISGVDALGGTDLNAMESHIAPIVGAVDMATLNHHGNRDSQNAFYVRTLRPRVWIQQNWSSDHPGEEVLRRISSKALYPGERDIFSTVMLQANKDVIGDRLNSYKSQQGHIVVRVHKKGAKYDIYILNDESEKREVVAKFGPYESK